MARKPVSILPEGGDVQARADEVRAGMWLLDPETGEWGKVKQAGIGNARSLSSLSDVPVFDPAHGARVVAMEDICSDEDTTIPAPEERA